jgi:hypothetical protein
MPTRLAVGAEIGSRNVWSAPNASAIRSWIADAGTSVPFVAK